MSPDSQIYDEFGRALADVARTWRLALNQEARMRGLNFNQVQVLNILNQSGEEMIQRELAARLGIEGASLVPILDAMEKQQLISRRASATDRRVNRVCVEPAGREKLTDVVEVISRVRRRLLQDIHSEDIATCLRVFGRLVEAAEKDGKTSKQGERHE